MEPNVRIGVIPVAARPMAPVDESGCRLRFAAEAIALNQLDRPHRPDERFPVRGVAAVRRVRAPDADGRAP